jgi:hypothetical protein
VLHSIRKVGYKVATILTESPYWDNWQAAWAALSTVVFTNERTSVGVLREHQPLTYYLPHAYDPAKHAPGGNGNGDHPDVPAHDVVFVGTDFPERVETLRAVDWDGIDLGLYGMWHSMGSRNKLRQYLHTGIVDNRMTAALYRHAKIGLNMHRQSADWSKDKPLITGAESLNPRAVELAANGVFTISDNRAEVGEVFGDVVPTYATPQELEELVRHYLAHPEERAEKAAQLPACVAGRTFDALGRQVLTTLEEYSGAPLG